MTLDDFRLDCRFFRSEKPCAPHKRDGRTCDNCLHYQPVSKRILLIKLDLIGDVLRTTPIIRRLRDRYPNCHITWVTRAPDLLPANQVDKILMFDYLAIFIVNSQQYDLAINLDKAEEACLLLKQVYAIKKFGFTWKDHHIEPVDQYAIAKIMTGLSDALSRENRKSYQEEIFEICGERFEGEEYLININHRLAEKWQWDIASRSSAKTVVGLNTGCGSQWRTRLWPTENWLQLIKQLHEAGYFCVILGGKAEDAQNRFLANETGAYYPGHFLLPEFIGLVSACDKIITSVTLALHVAIALQKDVILFNNVFNRHEFELYGRGIILEPSGGCHCYYENTCKKGESCMKNISVQQVIEVLHKIKVAE